jgi:hypothetical protein
VAFSLSFRKQQPVNLYDVAHAGFHCICCFVVTVGIHGAGNGIAQWPRGGLQGADRGRHRPFSARSGTYNLHSTSVELLLVSFFSALTVSFFARFFFANILQEGKTAKDCAATAEIRALFP